MTPDPLSDGDLVRRALDGDPSAFTSLVDRHAPACLRYAARLLGNREDAEDATQDTIMRVYRALGDYEQRTPFRTWLFAILVNQCRTSLLHRSRRERRVTADADRMERAAGPDQTDSLLLRVELQAAIDGLPSDQREAFLLKHVEQMEYAEMATISGVGVSALKMRVQRACQRLQLTLDRGAGAR